MSADTPRDEGTLNGAVQIDRMVRRSGQTEAGPMPVPQLEPTPHNAHQQVGKSVHALPNLASKFAQPPIRSSVCWFSVYRRSVLRADIVLRSFDLIDLRTFRLSLSLTSSMFDLPLDRSAKRNQRWCTVAIVRRIVVDRPGIHQHWQSHPATLRSCMPIQIPPVRTIACQSYFANTIIRPPRMSIYRTK
jgi:hypothetical protein